MRLAFPRGDTWSFSFPSSNSYLRRSQPPCVCGGIKKARRERGWHQELFLWPWRGLLRALSSIHPDLASLPLQSDHHHAGGHRRFAVTSVSTALPAPSPGPFPPPSFLPLPALLSPLSWYPTHSALERLSLCKTTEEEGFGVAKRATGWEL